MWVTAQRRSKQNDRDFNRSDTVHLSIDHNTERRRQQLRTAAFVIDGNRRHHQIIASMASGHTDTIKDSHTLIDNSDDVFALLMIAVGWLAFAISIEINLGRARFVCASPTHNRVSDCNWPLFKCDHRIEWLNE